MDGLVLSESVPAPARYIALRKAMGWGEIDLAAAERTLAAASFTVCLHRDDELLGLARVMGDGALYFFLADLIVAPEARGGGHGDRLMQAVVDYFDRAAKPGATITLVPMQHREALYERFGFVRCPDGPFGRGMHYRASPKP